MAGISLATASFSISNSLSLGKEFLGSRVQATSSSSGAVVVKLGKGKKDWVPTTVIAAAAATVSFDSDTPELRSTVPRLRGLYEQKVVPSLKEEFKYSNVFEIPRVEKVVVNCGIGEASQNAKTLESTIRDIALITGQKAVVTRSRKAIAGFKLRQGVPVGVCLTLRGEVMYSFLDRLMNLALPRTRDFQGVNPYSFDGRGNYTLGLPEQSVFPEIRFENIDKERGMDICIITSAKNDLEGLKLLSLMGMPFREAGGGRTSASAAKKKTRVTFRGKSKRR
jgi:large subunit ribosomal protein L5